MPSVGSTGGYIQAMPTFVLMRDGTVMNKTVGGQSWGHKEEDWWSCSIVSSHGKWWNTSLQVDLFLLALAGTCSVVTNWKLCVVCGCGWLQVAWLFTVSLVVCQWMKLQLQLHMTWCSLGCAVWCWLWSSFSTCSELHKVEWSWDCLVATMINMMALRIPLLFYAFLLVGADGRRVTCRLMQLVDEEDAGSRAVQEMM